MKNIKYIIIALALQLVAVSCSSDFLDTELNENASEEQVQDAIAKDPTKLKGYISGFYKNLFAPESMRSHDDFGIKALQLATDLMGEDMAYITSHFFVFDYKLDNRSSSYRRTASTWQQLYAVINGANEVISILEKEKDSGDPVIEQMLGESYTVRAFSYFWLINMYQQPYQWNKEAYGIPLYTEYETILNRVPVKEVYTQILSDIDTGYNFLEDKKPGSKAELNKYSAAAIYAKILEFVDDYPNQYEEIVKYAKIAIEGGQLMNAEQLTSGFNEINLPEVLWGAKVDGENNTFYASFMSHMDPYGPGYGGSSGSYKMIASDLYAKIADTDVRKEWFGIKIEKEDDPHYRVQQYVQKKFIDVGSLGIGDTFTSDYIYIRTGEMYFVAAEALYNLGRQEEAKQLLLEIVQSRDPEYTLDGKDLLEEIKIQKRIEMWGEGCRLLDMKRRGESLDRTKSTNHPETTVKEVPAGSRLFIYQIPDGEMNANKEIEEQNQ